MIPSHISLLTSHVLLRLASPHERSHEPAVDLPGHQIHVEPGALEKLPGVVHPVDPGRFDVHPGEAGLREEGLELLLLERPGHAPDPELHAPPYLVRHLAPDHDVRYREPPPRLEHPEGF